MSDDLSVAKEFGAFLRGISQEDLIPPICNPYPSPSEIIRAQLMWSIYEMRSVGTPMYEAYGSDYPIRVKYKVFEHAINQNSGIVREQLRKLEQFDPRISPIRIHDYKPASIEILPPSASDVRALMNWRIRRETEAALLVHRGKRFDGNEVEPHLKIYLRESLQKLLSQTRQELEQINQGRLSGKERRIKAEIIWQADCMLHRLLFRAAGMSIDEPVLSLLREKIRLLGSYRDVTLVQSLESQQEHDELADAILSGYCESDNTQQHVVDLVHGHMRRSEAIMIALADERSDDQDSDHRGSV